VARFVSFESLPRVVARERAASIARRFGRDRAGRPASHVEALGLRREPLVDIEAILPPLALLIATVAVVAATLLA